MSAKIIGVSFVTITLSPVTSYHIMNAANRIKAKLQDSWRSIADSSQATNVNN